MCCDVAGPLKGPLSPFALFPQKPLTGPADSCPPAYVPGHLPGRAPRWEPIISVARGSLGCQHWSPERTEDVSYCQSKETGAIWGSLKVSMPICIKAQSLSNAFFNWLIYGNYRNEIFICMNAKMLIITMCTCVQMLRCIPL